MPDSISPDQDTQNLEQHDKREIVNQSGGVSVDANHVSVGQDMVGRDKVIHLNIETYHADRAIPTAQEEHIARKESVRLPKNKWIAIVMFATLLVVLGIVFYLAQPYPDSSTSEGYKKVGDSYLLLLYPLECQDLWDNSSIEVRWRVSTQTMGQTLAVLDDGVYRSIPITITPGITDTSASFEKALRGGRYGIHTWRVIINEELGPKWEFHYKRFPEKPTCS
jgi:hypothetical protein